MPKDWPNLTCMHRDVSESYPKSYAGLFCTHVLEDGGGLEPNDVIGCYVGNVKKLLSYFV